MRDHREIQPHEALFRFVFGKPVHAASELRAVLPQGAATLLVRQLTRKFGRLPNLVQEQIDTASLEQLEVWSDRVLDAATLEEIFG